MKKILLTLVLMVGVVLGLFAQKLTYQAVIRDNNQQLVVNTAVKATVTITFSTGTPATYSEEVNGTTNLHGLLSIEFGDGSLVGRDWTGATIAVRVVNANNESTVYVGGDARPVSAVPYALSVDGMAIQQYLTEHHYVTADALDARHYLTSDSTVITTMQGNIATNKADITTNTADIAALAGRMNTFNTNVCDSVKNCDFSGNTSIQNMLQQLTVRLDAQNAKIDSLAHVVDSLSKLPHGGGEVADGQPCPGAATVSDGTNTYNTVKIGNQCWMAQNLRTDVGSGVYPKKNDGRDDLTPEEQVTYGRLYTWTAMMNSKASSDSVPSGVQGICPTGWHVPSDAEWDTLTRYVFSKDEYKCGDDCGEWQARSKVSCIANALSSPTGWNNSSTSGCNAGNNSATRNLTGFSAVPAGGCFGGTFNDFGNRAYFWSATQFDAGYACYRTLYSTDSVVYWGRDQKSRRFSVRCLRDAGTGGGGTTPVPVEVSCEQVMECMGDTLGKLNTKIENLKNTVDSLAALIPGGDTVKFTCGTSKVKDVDLNEYNTVKIGNQCWMKENLRTKIGGTGDKGYPTGAGADTVTYGRLYTWSAMMKGAPSTKYPAGTTDADTIVHGICPTGWHVPSDAEWDTLTYYVYNSAYHDYKCSGCISSVWEQSTKCIAKALADTTGWDNSETTCAVGNGPSANNATGFSAVPAGNYGSDYGNFRRLAGFWSATLASGTNAYNRNLYCYDANVYRYNSSKTNGFSVRCLKD